MNRDLTVFSVYCLSATFTRCLCHKLKRVSVDFVTCIPCFLFSDFIKSKGKSTDPSCVVTTASSVYTIDVKQEPVCPSIAPPSSCIVCTVSLFRNSQNTGLQRRKINMTVVLKLAFKCWALTCRRASPCTVILQPASTPITLIRTPGVNTWWLQCARRQHDFNICGRMRVLLNTWIRVPQIMQPCNCMCVCVCVRVCVDHSINTMSPDRVS